MQEETLVLYLKFLDLNLASPRSVENYLAGVKTMCNWLGLAIDVFSSSRVKLMLRAIHRTSTHIVKQAFPITPQILCDMKAKLNLDKPDDCTFFAACVVAFMLMLRKSNLVPDTSSAFTSAKQLSRRHLRFVRGAVWVSIVWSKTLQFRFKKLSYPLIKIPGSQLCPYTALLDMVKKVPGEQDGPCFAHLNGAPWTYTQFQRKLRQVLSQCGYNKHNFSSHSFRRGGCSFAWQSGMPEFLIKTIGDWKSDVYKNYCHIDFQSRAKACQVFSQHIASLQL